MKTKHTPGPWSWQKCRETYMLAKSGGGEIVLGNVQEESGELILACAGPNGLKAFNPGLPNAKLLAASPDLLKCCMSLYEFVVSLRELKAVEGPNIDRHIQEAASVLLKATK